MSLVNLELLLIRKADQNVHTGTFFRRNQCVKQYTQYKCFKLNSVFFLTVWIFHQIMNDGKCIHSINDINHFIYQSDKFFFQFLFVLSRQFTCDQLNLTHNTFLPPYDRGYGVTVKLGEKQTACAICAKILYTFWQYRFAWVFLSGVMAAEHVQFTYRMQFQFYRINVRLFLDVRYERSLSFDVPGVLFMCVCVIWAFCHSKNCTSWIKPPPSHIYII